MLAPAIPAYENDRLKALQELDILDTPSEDRFDRLVRLGQDMFEVPIALISLVDINRQWFKSCFGLDVRETSREISFCGHAILGKDIFYIPDAASDSRFADNPLVTGAPHIRFYVGAPLFSEGQAIGTLCMIDRRPRLLSNEQLRLLRDLADAVEQQLSLHNALEAARLLNAQSIRLRTILDTMAEGIVVIDADGSIESVNPAAESLFGYAPGDLTGRHISQLIPDHQINDYGRYLTDFRQSGIQRHGMRGRELSGKRFDGSEFPIELTLSRMVIEECQLITGIVRDISERKQAEQQLREIDQQRQLILDSARASIISVNTEGVIQTFNKGAEKMLGYTAAEVIGIHKPQLFHDPDEARARTQAAAKEFGSPVPPGMDAFAFRIRQTGEPVSTELTYIRKDGSRFAAQLTVSPLHNPDGSISGFMGIGSDISERKHLDRMKSEFVSTVSHELRTPLTAIRGALGLVLGKAADGLSPKAKQLLETACRNSERLTLLINDILDLEKIVSGGMEFNMASTDLVTVTRLAIQASEGYAERYQVRLALTESPEQAIVCGDEHRLLQVFANLVSNAVKFSYTGGVVELAIRPCGQGWRVSVADHGRGIPESFRHTVFQRFAQADSSDTREQGGTGLGLSICKAIIDRHDGYIGYNSTLGVGTEFFFELPAAGQPIPIDPTTRT